MKFLVLPALLLPLMASAENEAGFTARARAFFAYPKSRWEFVAREAAGAARIFSALEEKKILSRTDADRWEIAPDHKGQVLVVRGYPSYEISGLSLKICEEEVEVRKAERKPKGRWRVAATTVPRANPFLAELTGKKCERRELVWEAVSAHGQWSFSPWASK